MNGIVLDAFVLVLLVAMVVGGYQRGAIASLAAIACAGIGALLFATIAATVAPKAVAIGALFGALTGAAALSTQLGRIREGLDDLLDGNDLALQVDRFLGMFINGVVALTIAWVAGVVLANAQTRNHTAEAARSSHMLGVLFGVMSPTGSTAAAIARSGLVPALQGPVIIVDDPDAAITTAPAVLAVRPQVVRVIGRSCNDIATGTAWPIASNLLVTNAHVVAGERSTGVQFGGHQPTVPVRVVGFDPANDVAILQSPQLRMTPLPLRGDAPHGEPGAIIGYPRQRNLQVNAARFDRVVTFPTTDIYDHNSTTLPVAVFRGEVEPGNSGSPIVDAQGHVLMMVAADAIGQNAIGGFGVPVAVIERAAAAVGTAQVATGPCLAD